MARAAVGWGVRDLAAQAKVGVATVTRFENGRAVPVPAILSAIRSTLEAAGVVFLADGQVAGGGPGGRLQDGATNAGGGK